MVFQPKWLHGSKNPEYQPTYNSWADMNKRCYDVTRPNYQDYGGRGITVCDRWRYSFDNFIGDLGVRPAGMTLERINNNGDYEKSNCRWATRAEQSLNTRQNRIVSFRNKEIPLTQAAIEAGLTARTVRSRLARGWSEQRALSEPVRLHTQSRKAIHGTNSKYALGCRCSECIEASRKYNRGLRMRRSMKNVGLA